MAEEVATLPDESVAAAPDTQKPWEKFAKQKPWEMFSKGPAAAKPTPTITPALKLEQATAVSPLQGLPSEHVDPSMTQADIISGRGGSSESAANVFRSVGGTAGKAMDYAGNVARGFVTDIVNQFSAGDNYAENLDAALRGGEMPVDVQNRQLAQAHPNVAAAAMTAQGALKSAPLLAAGGLPALEQRAIALGFTAQMVAGVKRLATDYGAEIGKPVDQRDPAKLAQLRSELIQTGVFAPLAGAYGAKPGPPKAPPQGPMATGALLQTPKGAMPPPEPEFGPVPGVPTRGNLPTPTIQDPRVAKTPVEVPGTPAEAYETEDATVRRADARTKEQIQKLFPQAGLSREEAAKIRDRVWGPQPKTEGGPNASGITSPEGVSQPEVRTQVGQETRVRQPGETPGTRQAPPEAQAGAVSLTPKPPPAPAVPDAAPITGKVTAENIDTLTPEQQGTLKHGHGIEYGLTLSEKEAGQSGTLQKKYDAAAEEMKQAAQKGDNGAMKAAFGRLNFFGGALMGATRGRHPISGSNYARFIEQHPDLAPKPPVTPSPTPSENAPPVAGQPASIAGEQPASGAAKVEMPGSRPGPATAIADTSKHPIVEVPVSEIKLSEDVPNFKFEADPKTGIVPSERLGGKYQRVGTAPIVIWERLDGTKEVITGRHRLDLARRNGETSIPAQIMREADGFTQAQALTFDAESNIRDGQGSVEDYAHYFKNTPSLTEADARSRGLLSRAKGENGWRLGKDSSDDVYALWRDGKITTEKAVAIARAAPGNADLQGMGIKQALKGRSAAEIENFIKAVQIQTGGAPDQIDLFGRDDSAIRQAEEMAAKASAKQSEISEQIRAVQSAAKRPEAAKKLGVDVKDPAGVLTRVNELKQDLERWQSWPLHPELVAEVGGRVKSEPTPAAPAAPAPKPAAAGKLTKAEQDEFRELSLIAKAAREEGGKPLTTEQTKRYQQLEAKAGQEDLLAEPAGANEKAEMGEIGTIRTKADEFERQSKLLTDRAFDSKEPDIRAGLLKQAYDAADQADRLRGEANIREYKLTGKKAPAGDLSLQGEVEAPPEKKSSQEGELFGFGGASKRGAAPAATNPKQLVALQNAMTPGLASSTKGAVQSLLLPTSKSAAHLETAEALGARLGALNHRQESTAHELAPASKVFDRLGVHNEKLPPDKNPGIKFMSDMSQGRPMTGPFQKIAAAIQRLFQERLDKLEEAGAPLDSVRKNYFPGMWTNESRLAFNAAMDDAIQQGVLPKDADVNQASPQQKAWVKSRVDEYLKSGKGSEGDWIAYLSRRPMKGRETFRKEKVFDDIMTGAEFGLRPISNNPVDLVKLKLAEMDKSIMGNEFFRDRREKGRLKTINPYEDVPEGWIKLDDKYGKIYGPPTVKVPEHIDKAVYEGLVDFASTLGIKHERSMKFPSGPGARALGLSYQGMDFIRSRFATETSVVAHEIGHQLDYRFDFWKRFVTDAVGLGAKGVQTKGASQKMRGQIMRELRAIADMTGGRGGNERKKEEQIAQMVEAYVHSPEAMKAAAPTVFGIFDKFIRGNPKLKPLADIKPGIELTKLIGEKYVGLPILGYRIVPKPDADIINNYLSSSIYNNKLFGPLYKSWMATANALNQTQLGMGSAFHAGFTTIDVQLSAGALLLKDVYGLLRGNRSLSNLAETSKKWLGATVKTGWVTGDKVLNAWRNPRGVIDPRITQVVKATELAGGGFRMERGLQTEQTTKLVRDWYSGHPLKAAARSPIAFTELMMKPIMQFLVPRQKAGVFAELAWRIIEQNTGKELEALTPQFRQAWNRIDARLGQVRYNRLFLNTAAKELAQGMIRAPGWSGGTIAEIGGAFPDTAKFFAEWAKTGKLPENIPDRAAYTISLLMTVGAINAALTYAFTGQAPHGMDLLAFRNGRKDKNGNEQRFLLPSYVKDILAYDKQFGQTLINKSHPLAGVIGDIAKNRDYYGYEIRNPNAPAAQRAGQVAKYVISSFEPFWTRGARQTLASGAPATEVVAPFVGIMPAPAYINRSAIQNEISKLYHDRTGERLKPYEARQADAAKKKAHDSSTMDIYMFKRLPQSDKDALRKKMAPPEIRRYFA